jgi:hypothetical protein
MFRFRQTLYAENVARYINANMVTWGGNIWSPEAYNLSMQLKVSTYPYLAMLICQSDRTVQIVDRIQGGWI